jgi:hypothetical protein
MFKGFNNRQQHSFPNINFGGNYGQAYNFSRCLLWLDAAYGTSTVVNGANVSSWQDKINGVQYTQATAGNQPTYVASDANFNNLPAIDFGVNLNKVLFSTSASFGLGSMTHLLVVRNQTTTAPVANLILGNGAQIGFTGGGAGANITGFGYQSAGTAFTRTNIEDTNMHIVVANRNFIIVDGVNQTAATNTNFGFTFAGIGGQDGNYRPNCSIAEILIYDYEMSQADAIQLSSNINAKYLKY